MSVREKAHFEWNQIAIIVVNEQINLKLVKRSSAGECEHISDTYIGVV